MAACEAFKALRVEMSSSFDFPRRIHSFAASFDRWAEEGDQSAVPPYVQALISTPARDLHNISSPQRVTLSTSIAEILEIFQGVRTVIVDFDALNMSSRLMNKELILSRLVFLERALVASNLSEPLSTIIDSIPPLSLVHGHDTLDLVLQRMLSSGFEEVGVIDGGIMIGVAHVDDVFAFMSKELTLLGCLTNQRHTPHKLFEGNGDADDSSLTVEKSAEIQARLEKMKTERRMSPIQISAQHFCKGYWTEVLLIMCILLDVSCAIVVYAGGSEGDLAEEKLQVATGIILFIFAYEAFVRIYGFRSALLRLPFEVVDLTIVLVSVIVYCLVLQDLLTSDSKSIMTLARIIRGLRMFKVLKLVVGLVMKQRMLYNRDGFALDLSYVTRNCVAMSRPAVGSEANFANPIEEVARFFHTKHPERYIIFNLCAEESYGEEHFAGRVERIPVEKHNPPRLGQIVGFVERAGQLMEEDPKACIAVHCRSGRDRTGVMVAAWLMYSRFADSADDAMQWFVSHRVRSRAAVGEGIPMPSQVRYVRYYEAALRLGGFYTKRLLLRRVVVQTCPAMDADGGCNLWYTVEEDGREVFCSVNRGKEGEEGACVRLKAGDREAAFEVSRVVTGDVRLRFYNKVPAAGRDELCFFLCFHTGFVEHERVVFDKEAVDLAASDARCRVFRPGFAVRLEFDHVFAEAGAAAPGAAAAAAATAAAAKGAAVVGARGGGGGGAGLGAFRKLLRASPRVVEAAVQMRGRDLSVQIKSAARLQKKVRWAPFRFASRSDFGEPSPRPAARAEMAVVVEEAGLAELEDLCCAAGPEVLHESVDLFKSVEAAGAAAMSQSKNRFSPTKYISQSLGARLARSLVSGNKRRFVEDGFDLDLSYITARVIAMGFPSSGLESSYRNSKEDVYRFFQERHAAHYRIVNLCSERAYSLDTFHGNCVRYPFDDHNPPALELLLPCCAHIHKFLQADPDNVVAIHCKAGKGRTGLVVVCYLLYCGLHRTAAAALSFYGWARTTDGKGVTIISQIRYAHYFEHLLRSIKLENRLPQQASQDRAPALLLHRFRLHSVPRFNSDGGCHPTVTVAVKSELDHQDYVVFKSAGPAGAGAGGAGRNSIELSPVASAASMPPAGAGSVIVLPPAGPGDAERIDIVVEDPGGAGARVAGDVRATFRDEGKGKVMCFFVVHTALMTRPPADMGGVARRLTDSEWAAEGLPPAPGQALWSLALRKHEIDRAAKDTRCAHFDADFRVEIFFSELPGQTGTGPALDAAREEAARAAGGGSGDVTAAPREKPLWVDRQAYHKEVQLVTAAGAGAAAAGEAGHDGGGVKIPSFEEWLLGYLPERWPVGGVGRTSSMLLSAAANGGGGEQANGAGKPGGDGGGGGGGGGGRANRIGDSGSGRVGGGGGGEKMTTGDLSFVGSAARL